MAFPSDPLDAKVELAIGADLRADPATWSWTDVTAVIREQQKVTITRGRRNRIGNIPPMRVTATADNANGDLCRHNPFGAHYGDLKKNTPMRVSVDNGSGYITRAAAYVPGFPPSWDPSERDQTVTLQAVGITDRLGRSKRLKSAMYRTTVGLAADDYRPFAYWPMEDGSGATQFASAIVGIDPLPISTLSPGADDDLTGSLPLPTMPAGTSFTVSAPLYTDVGMWTVQMVIKIPVAPSVTTTYVEVHNKPGGTVARWRFYIEPGSPDIAWCYAYNAAGTSLTNIGVPLDGFGVAPTEDEFYNHWIQLVFSEKQDGSDYAFKFSLVNQDASSANGAGDVGTHGVLDRITFSGAAAISLGHIAIISDLNYDIDVNWSTVGPALDGWVGEMAHERAIRLCREERVPFTTTATTSQAMGPQGTGKLLDLLRECANTDQGLLYEDMNFGLTFVSSTERYNQPAAITLEYDQGEILPPWDPTDDDQDYFNDVTATRPGGASYTAADADDVEEVGEYPDAINPNVETDTQLQQIAGWRKNVGLNDELTWPAVRPNLLLGGALLDAWLTADLGGQMWMTGHPSPLAPYAIRQIIEGYTETLGSYTYDVSANLSPASVWDVAVYGVDPGGIVSRYGAGTTVLAEDLTSSETAADVNSGTDTWVTTATHPTVFPLNVDIGGLTYSCTAITGTKPNYTLTLVRLATDKTHSTGDAVTVTDTGRYGL